MYKDSKRTYIAIVLLIKPFVWWRSRRRRRRGLLKLPNIIPHKEGIEAISLILVLRNHSSQKKFCTLIQMILGMNNFSFNQQYFLQIHGTAMGTPMAPSYASLLMGKFEQNTVDDPRL